MSRRRVTYYYDPDVGAYTFGAHQYLKPHRSKLTHDLLDAYGLLPKMHVLKPLRASEEQLAGFHTDEYVQFLSKVTPETFEKLSFGGTRFLVGEDNPAFEGVFEFCSIAAGGSIAAAQRIANGSADIAINWAGGLHHAKKSEASGFCYVNDIVLCILELLRSYARVLYIDLDVHHGDGVEEAFYTTDRVLTCSFHKYGSYFPGTGDAADRGRGRGRGYSVNIPLNDGIGDEAFRSVYEPVVERILDVYRPDVVVLQCGADSLSGDKLGCFNLSMHGHAHCVKWLRAKNIPLVLLGGGGYTVKNVARAWTYETAVAIGQGVDDAIDANPVLPYSDAFEWFGPRFRLEVLPSNMDDLNVDTLDAVRRTALQQLSELPPAPSVALQDVPRTSIGAHLFRPLDELDAKLADHFHQARQIAASQSDRDSDLEDSEDDVDPDAGDRPRPRRRHMSIVTNHFHGRDGDEDSCSHRVDRKRHFFDAGLALPSGRVPVRLDGGWVGASALP